MKKLFLLATAGALIGCYHRTNLKTPVGTERHTMIAAGIYSSTDIDTVSNFKRCRELLKPGHAEEEPLIDRDVYQSCFNNHMLPVRPMGQRSSPIPVDVNGDGRPDAMRYTEGYEVPLNLYSSYPGVYWPGAYQQYGYNPEDFGASGVPLASPTGFGPMGAGMPAGFGPGALYAIPPSPPGRRRDAGTPTDPAYALAVVNAHRRGQTQPSSGGRQTDENPPAQPDDGAMDAVLLETANTANRVRELEERLDRREEAGKSEK
jgi:hypothetical protein